MKKDGRSIPDETLEIMRFRAIEAYKSGETINSISKTFGIHRGSVSRWITKWNRKGKRALVHKKASGRPTKID